MDSTTPRFGIEEEWRDFHERHPVFQKEFSNLVGALKAAFIRTFTSKTPAERVVFHLSNLCKEDFMEILLLAGNGYGTGAEKLLRGLYERAVTARYIATNPDRAADFVDFGKINMFKLIEPIRRAHGEGLLPANLIAELTNFHREFKRRGRTPKGAVDRLKRSFRRLLRRSDRGRSTARWTDDLSFEAMALKVGSLGRMLVYGWHLPTLQVHASLQNITSRTCEMPEGGIEFDGGPQRQLADGALNFATLILLDVLQLQKDSFGLTALEPLLQQCNADYLEVWHPERFPGSD